MRSCKFLLTAAIAIILAACSIEEERDLVENPIFEKYLSSESFNKLPIGSLALNFKQYQIVKSKSGKTVINIPTYADKNEFVIAFMKNDEQFVSFLVEAKTNSGGDEYETFMNHKYSSNIMLKSEDNEFSFTVENSKLVSTDFTLDQPSAKCNNMRDVLECAATNIDNMRTIAWLACMVEIPICLAIEAADCLLDGCAILGS